MSGLVAVSGNSRTVEVETGRSLASLASQSILIGKLQGRARESVSKKYKNKQQPGKRKRKNEVDEARGKHSSS